MKLRYCTKSSRIYVLNSFQRDVSQKTFFHDFLKNRKRKPKKRRFFKTPEMRDIDESFSLMIILDSNMYNDSFSRKKKSKNFLFNFFENYRTLSEYCKLKNWVGSRSFYHVILKSFRNYCNPAVCRFLKQEKFGPTLSYIYLPANLQSWQVTVWRC